MSGELNEKCFGREIKPLERMRSVGRSAAEQRQKTRRRTHKALRYGRTIGSASTEYVFPKKLHFAGTGIFLQHFVGERRIIGGFSIVAVHFLSAFKNAPGSKECFLRARQIDG